LPLLSGTRLGPYEIRTLVGTGGMGEVYRAVDTRLDRTVAIKMVSPQLAVDPQFRERFDREARTVSRLSHPNICTLFDIGHYDGSDFLVMEFVEGETLAQRLSRGPLPVDEALGIARQVADALTLAHREGIVHRDIKPANLMIGDDGLVRVLDFGIAKRGGPTDITQEGAIVGTLSYMAPEQLVHDGRITTATDVWSVGVVLYEMLTGTRPFSGRDDIERLRSIVTERPHPVGEGRSDLPRPVERLVERCLRKNPADRFSSAVELGLAIDNVRAGIEGAAEPRRVSFWWLAAAGVLALVALGIAVHSLIEGQQARRAREEGLPEVQRLIQEDDYPAAYALAEQLAQALPGDPALDDIWAAVGVTGSIDSQPQGAEVFYKPYASTDETWELLGQTPIEHVRLPRGSFRFLVRRQGYQDAHLAHALTAGFTLAPIVLRAVGEASDMVHVPADELPVNLSGFNSETLVRVGPFLIDRTEVTNRAYRDFVSSGAYTSGTGWPEGATPARYLDSTGRPGPAGWELGGYAAGTDEEPVGGVSWYEAAAFCSAQGKQLPTVYHWARATLAPREITAPLGPSIVPLSNFGGQGPAAVGAFAGMGPYGTFDGAGNVREWVLNASESGRRWILGGAWTDPDYMFSVPLSLPPDDRSAVNGFRCIQPLDGEGADTLAGPIDVSATDYRDARPVSDETFEVFARQFTSVPSTTAATVEERIETPTGSIRERVTMDAGYDGERLTVYVFLPSEGTPPYQAMIYFPALNAFQNGASSRTFFPGDYIVRSGRALVLPVYKGSFERWDPALELTGEEYFRATRQRLLHWRQDIGRTIDYLQSRDDIDAERIGYYGRSFGASMPLPLLALEPRIKVAVLHSAGFTYRRLPAEMDAVNYVSRVRIPILMMTGRHDYVFPYETSQRPLFALFGTPAADKRHVVYDAGHDPLPRSQFVREILSFLDRYFGDR